MSDCIYKGSEPSPKGLGYCANSFPSNTIMLGNNGNLWIVKQDKNYKKRWVQAKEMSVVDFRSPKRKTSKKLTSPKTPKSPKLKKSISPRKLRIYNPNPNPKPKSKLFIL